MIEHIRENEAPDVIRGQVLAVRESRNATFMDVGLPGDESTQVVVRGEGAAQPVKAGDIIVADGELGETELSIRRGLGQISLFAESFDVVADNERPRWPGADTRERLTAQADYIDMLRRRHATHRSLRNTLDDDGYTAIDTSILQKTASGAAARTFETKANFDGRERHLRIAPEIDLKVVMALSGLERVYEIGRLFRNEGTDVRHHPEFTNLETYTAYQTREEAVQLTENLLNSISKAQGTDYDFTNIPRTSVADLFARYDVDFDTVLKYVDGDDIGALRAYAKTVGVNDADSKGASGIIDAIIKRRVRPHVDAPLLVDGYLSDQLPLAASLKSDDRFADAFQVMLKTAEMVKAYQEEVDPNKLRRKLIRQAGEDVEDAFRNDTRLINAAEMGLPPMYGIGFGLDNFTATITGKSTRDVIPMPIDL
jgi:lysyl-tRNA synthetase class 2